MKQLRNFLSQASYTTYWLIVYITIILSIWLIPPYLNHSWGLFLQLPSNRILITLLFSAMMWFLYEQFSNKLRFHKQANTQHPELVQQLRSIITQLKSTKTIPASQWVKSSRKINLTKLPWILVLGTAKSGKTEILKYTGIKFLFKRKSSNNIRFITCYAAKEAAIFEAAGRFEQIEEPVHTHSAWQTFLQYCQQHRRSFFNGIVLNLSIQQLTNISASQLNQLLAQHKKQLQILNQLSRQSIPLTISINHINNINGFNAYFANLDHNARNQAWGLGLNQYEFNDINQLCERFDQSYDLFTQSLHNEIIGKLHQQLDIEQRAAIQEFPTQIEALKRPLARILQYLSECFVTAKGVRLQGIYFTATGQTSSGVDRLLPAINKTFSLTSPNNTSTTYMNQYFIRGLYARVIIPSVWQQTQQSYLQYRYPSLRYVYSLGAVSILTITCTIIWTKQLATNIEAIDNINQNLNQYIFQDAQNKLSIQKALKALDILENIANKLDTKNHAKNGITIFNQQQLSDLAKTAYQKAVNQFIYFYLTSTLEQIITQSDQENSAAQIYSGLKFYLKLIKQQSLNSYDLEMWLAENNSANKLTPIQSKIFQKHVSGFTLQNPDSSKINLPLIENARKKLIDLPRHELALTMILQELAENIPRREISLKSINQMVPILLAKSNIIIPGIYSREAFKETYENLIPQAAKMALQGNWVTGRLATDHSTDLQKFTQKIADLYFEKYALTWQKIFDNLQLVSLNSYPHAIQVIDNFLTQDSPLVELLQIINYHTDIKYNGISTPISIKFQGIPQLFNSYSGNHYSQIIHKIRKLQEVLVTIANTSDHHKTSFLIAKQRMLNQHDDIFDEIEKMAIRSPAPLQQWLLKLNQSSWQLILNDAKGYINNEWNLKVVNYYQKNLQPYYPFAEKARKEVRLSEFNQFFSQLGIVDKFYLDYLAPFINNEMDSLAWRKMNASTLSSNNAFLANLEQLLNIRDAFFNKIPNKASLEFTVQPLALQPIIKTALFSLDDQQAGFSQYAQLSQTFYWPTEQTLHMAALSLYSVDGRQVKASEAGLWSLFRLLNYAKIKPTQEKQSVIAIFELNGYGIELELNNNSNANPFKPYLFSSLNLAAMV